MASLLSALYTGASGIFTNQTAVQVTGNNIANSSTTGYSRQIAQVVSTAPLTQGGLTYGTGSAVESIARASDPFIVRQLAALCGAYGEYSAASTPLADIERIVGIGDSCLSSDIDSFFDAWEQLSTYPSGTAERQQVLQEAADLVERFHQIVQQLSEVVHSINISIESTVPDLNDQLAKIADLNQSIMQTELTGGNANTLRDQRDILVQQVSETCGATMYTDGNGMVCLQLQGGLPLVTGTFASSLTTTSSDGLSQISLTCANTTFSLDYEDFGGTLKGLLQVRDSVIPQFRDDIDRLAYAIATDVNTLIATSGGVDQNGDAAIALFSLTAPTDPQADDWQGAAATIVLAVQTIAQIPTGTTAAPADNSLCLGIAALRDTSSLNGSTYSGEYARIAAKAGLLVRSNEQHLSASSESLDQLYAKQDSLTGVSTDEEMIALIRYQAGYQAASKYIAVIKEMLDTLNQL